jgi:VanZ family protein
MQSHHPKLSCTLTFCIASIIIALTLSPALVVELSVFDLWDKAQHTLAFALLVLPNACWNRRALPVTALAAALLGGVIEVIQPLVGRAASWGDFTADLVGVALGAALGTLLVLSLRRLQAGRAG